MAEKRIGLSSGRRGIFLPLLCGAGLFFCGMSGCVGKISGQASERRGDQSAGSTDDGLPLGGLTPAEVLASPACQLPAPGRAPLRRLSNAEYRNTLTDLLGSDQAALVATATGSFLSETESLGFRNNADYLGVSPTTAQGYLDAAEPVLDAIIRNKSLLSCTPAVGAELDCARIFIRDFGKLALMSSHSSSVRS